MWCFRGSSLNTAESLTENITKKNRSATHAPLFDAAYETDELLLRFRVIVCDLRPVNGVPPGSRCIPAGGSGTSGSRRVPRRRGRRRLAAIDNRIVLVGGGLDHQFAVADQQPRPAGAEASGGGRRSNFVLKSAKLPKAPLIAVARSPLGFAAAALLHDLPEHASGSDGRRRCCAPRCECFRAPC